MSLIQILLFTFVLVKSAEQKTVHGTLSPEEESALTSIRNGTKHFFIELVWFISESDRSKPMFVCPLSVQVMLALARFGAKGTTETELTALLYLSELDHEKTLLGYRSLMKEVEDPGLILANKMFVETTAPVKEDFQTIAEKYFSSPVESLDFQTASEESREHINSWVELKTDGKIKDLLASGTITQDTRLVLVNAIHFKANWKTKFDESKTKEQSFYLSSTKTVQVQMMNIKSTFQFCDDHELKEKTLRLDYDGGKFEMVIILPYGPEGLNDLEPKLEDISVFRRVQEPFVSTTVDVYLPKFKIEKTNQLNSALKTIGVPTMFSDSANFSGLTDERLKVSEVIQKAFIEVNEEGTREAAASAVVINRLTAAVGTDKSHYETFKADHPFGFIIFLKEPQIPIFFGRYTGPE